MQPTIGGKRFVITHVGAMALVIGVLLSATVAVAGLAVTENLPWQAGADGQVRVDQRSVMSSAAQLQQVAARKEARQEAAELEASGRIARAAQQGALQSYYEHKERQSDTLP